jgi:hypothetical protein
MEQEPVEKVVRECNPLDLLTGGYPLDWALGFYLIGPEHRKTYKF